MLKCAECSAKGRIVFHVVDVEDVDPPFAVVYCRACAERELGLKERASEGAGPNHRPA